MLNRTSSQVCSSLYLSIFLFMDGSFTLMNIASFIILAKFCWFPSQCADIFHNCVVACDVRMLINRRRIFKMLFKSSSKSPSRLTHVFLVTLLSSHTYIYTWQIFLCDCVFILGGHQEDLDCIASFEVYLYPLFAPHVLKAFTKHFSVR